MTTTQGRVEKLTVQLAANSVVEELIRQSGFVLAIEMFGEEIRLGWLKRAGFLQEEGSENSLDPQGLRHVADELSKIVWNEVDKLGQDSDKGLEPLHTDAKWGADSLDDEGFAARSELLLIQCLRLLSNLLNRDDRVIVEYHEKTIR